MGRKRTGAVDNRQNGHWGGGLGTGIGKTLCFSRYSLNFSNMHFLSTINLICSPNTSTATAIKAFKEYKHVVLIIICNRFVRFRDGKPALRDNKRFQRDISHALQCIRLTDASFSRYCHDKSRPMMLTTKFD